MTSDSIEDRSEFLDSVRKDTYEKLWGVEGVRELDAAYYKERLQLMREGMPTWIVRNSDIVTRDSDMGAGVVYDFALRGELVGYVEEEGWHSCDIYVRDEEGKPQALNASPVTVENAVAIMENFARYR